MRKRKFINNASYIFKVSLRLLLLKYSIYHIDVLGDQSPGGVQGVGGRHVLHGEESETQAARQSWTGQPQTRLRSRNSEETGTVK